jgi:hypothetical protein
VKEEIAKKWAEALRSGKYKQTENDSGTTFDEIADIIEKNWEHL